MNMMHRPPHPAAPRTTPAREAQPASAAVGPTRPQAVPPRVPGMAAARPMPPGAATSKADELFMVMRQLCELLTKENAALKRHKTEEVKEMTPRKDQLAQLYQSHMNAVHRDPAVLKGLDTAKRTALMQMATRLAELMRDNASMLKANIRSIDTFFQAVTDAVRDRQEKKSASYSRAGVLNGYAAVKKNLAVSYNRTL
jgi:hypothetical protein